MDKQIKTRIIVVLVILLFATLFALAGSQNGLVTQNGFPIFALGILVAISIQIIAFIPANLLNTMKFYDLVGSGTYLSVILMAFFLSENQDLRSIILVVIVSLWALRLGSFLFMRAMKSGEDSRFEEIMKSSSRFFITWLIQGLWVSITVSAALVAIASKTSVDFGIVGIIGVVIWIMGFSIEVLADMQKSNFKKDPANKGKFISTGIWSRSRHPNYFGEILLWIGVMIIALPVLQGWQFITLLSPIFVILLLTKVSGVPLLEKQAEERWGGQEDYETYKSSTPVLIPKLFK